MGKGRRMYRRAWRMLVAQGWPEGIYPAGFPDTDGAAMREFIALMRLQGLQP